jgi:hypothetical protein
VEVLDNLLASLELVGRSTTDRTRRGILAEHVRAVGDTMRASVMDPRDRAHLEKRWDRVMEVLGHGSPQDSRL